MSDFSFGIIAVCMTGEETEFLLIQHKNKAKHWAFPKGHKEEGENDLTAAKREFEEETGIDSKLLYMEGGWSQATRYRFFAHWLNKAINKKVRYFLGYLDEKHPITIQDEELLDYAWLPYEEALSRFTYDTDRELLQSAAKFLKLI